MIFGGQEIAAKLLPPTLPPNCRQWRQWRQVAAYSLCPTPSLNPPTSSKSVGVSPSSSVPQSAIASSSAPSASGGSSMFGSIPLSSAISSAPSLSASVSAGASLSNSISGSSSTDAPLPSSSALSSISMKSSAVTSSASSSTSASAASPSSSAIPDCTGDCLTPNPDELTPYLVSDLDDEDVDVANITSTASSLTNPSTNNATKANSTLTRALHLKRVRVINLCKAGKTFALTVKSNGPGADAFKTNLKTNAAVLYDMTGTSFDVDDSGRVSDANALKGTRASPTKYIIEHVFEFQILSRFLEAQDAATTVAKNKAASATPPQPAPPDSFCDQYVRNNPQNAGFQAIVDLIDDPKNMVYAYDIINKIKLQMIANHKFGIKPLDQGFIAGSEYSDDFKNLNEPKAVAKREEVQQYLRGSGATVNYMNAVAPMFKDAASKVTAELKKIDQKLSDAFSDWLKDEVNDYQNRLQTSGKFLAESYKFQESTRTQVPNLNSFDIDQVMAAITGSDFPTLNAAALLP